ncbi:unnamed protein product [Colias eurytheme]|nr:unnamed protein product [Colias eurytheme]
MTSCASLYHSILGMIKVYQLQHSKTDENLNKLGDVTDDIKVSAKKLKSQNEMNDTFDRDLIKQLNHLTTSIAQFTEKIEQKTLESYRLSKRSCTSKNKEINRTLSNTPSTSMASVASADSVDTEDLETLCRVQMALFDRGGPRNIHLSQFIHTTTTCPTQPLNNNIERHSTLSIPFLRHVGLRKKVSAHCFKMQMQSGLITTPSGICKTTSTLIAQLERRRDKQTVMHVKFKVGTFC